MGLVRLQSLSGGKVVIVMIIAIVIPLVIALALLVTFLLPVMMALGMGGFDPSMMNQYY
jgi:hypothetical protein